MHRTPIASSVLGQFERIRVINLPARADRRRAVSRELRALGETIDGNRVAFHPASRPADRSGFDSIGAKGCFLSHLSVLQEAQRDGVSSLLILEDDVSFSASEVAALPLVLECLSEAPWGIFYGGSPVAQQPAGLSEIQSSQGVPLAHFIAFTRQVIHCLVPYLEAILERPPGSPEGGPMHVDGAYSWFRNRYPDVSTFAAIPPIAHQRASATDIHERRGIDRVPLVRHLLIPARGLKNRWRARR